jgi:uncharacterized protein YukE
MASTTSGTPIQGQITQMQKGSTAVGTAIANTKTILLATDEAVTSLMTGWASDAAGQFNTIMKRWDQDMVNVIASLERIQAELDNTTFTYNKQQFEEMGLTGDFAKTIEGLTPVVPK